MLKLSQSDYFSLRRHGEETYPHECCGVLLGQFDDSEPGLITKTVSHVVRCGNTREDSPHNRYHIDPKELIRIQREGRERGEDILGFYHSHPDHPAQWSATDLAEAHWFGCSYVITSVEKGAAAKTNSFELTGTDESGKKFVDEQTTILDRKRPLGVVPIGAFLVFGASMAAYAAVTLLYPGTTLDHLWALNGRGHIQLESFGRAIGFVFVALSIFLAVAAIGWFRGRYWGWVLATTIVAINATGDLINGLRGEWRKGSVGVAIAGLLLIYMTKSELRNYFRRG